MPFVHVKITPEGATAERKREVIAGITKVLVDVLGKDPATTMIVIDVVDTESWGLHGTSVAALRASGGRT